MNPYASTPHIPSLTHSLSQEYYHPTEKAAILMDDTHTNQRSYIAGPPKMDKAQGVWVVYTNQPSLFEENTPVVLFADEVSALRYAVADTSRIMKVVYVPFGKLLLSYLK